MESGPLGPQRWVIVEDLWPDVRVEGYDTIVLLGERSERLCGLPPEHAECATVQNVRARPDGGGDVEFAELHVGGVVAFESEPEFGSVLDDGSGSGCVGPLNEVEHNAIDVDVGVQDLAVFVS